MIYWNESVRLTTKISLLSGGEWISPLWGWVDLTSRVGAWRRDRHNMYVYVTGLLWLGYVWVWVWEYWWTSPIWGHLQEVKNVQYPSTVPLSFPFTIAWNSNPPSHHSTVHASTPFDLPCSHPAMHPPPQPTPILYLSSPIPLLDFASHPFTPSFIHKPPPSVTPLPSSPSPTPGPRPPPCVWLGGRDYEHISAGQLVVFSVGREPWL